MTSTSFSTGAGLKKCMPTTRDGRPVATEISVTDRDEVLVARIVSGWVIVVEPGEDLALELEVLGDGLDDQLDVLEVLQRRGEPDPLEDRGLLVLGQLAAPHRAVGGRLDVAAPALDGLRRRARPRRRRARCGRTPRRSRRPSCRGRRPRPHRGCPARGQPPRRSPRRWWRRSAWRCPTCPVLPAVPTAGAAAGSVADCPRTARTDGPATGRRRDDPRRRPAGPGPLPVLRPLHRRGDRHLAGRRRDHGPRRRGPGPRGRAVVGRPRLRRAARAPAGLEGRA